MAFGRAVVYWFQRIPDFLVVLTSCLIEGFIMLSSTSVRVYDVYDEEYKTV